MTLNSKSIKAFGRLALLTLCVLGITMPQLQAAVPNNAKSKPLTAAEAVNKGSATLFNSKGIKASFTIIINGKKGSGSLCTKGKKFMVESPFGSTWYNGVSLYSYNPRSKETTVTKPTQSELNEANPLSYINLNKAFAAKDVINKPDKRVVALTPYDKKMGIKSIELTLNPESCLPQVIKLSLDNGTSSTIAIQGLLLDAYPDAKVFEYPKNKYPGVEVIDLR